MKHGCIFLLLMLFTSCEYFNVKKVSSETILQEELQTFNWNDVDEYPTFSSCDATSSKSEKKVCFEQTLTAFITNHLQKDTLVVTQDINDTISLNFRVTSKGYLILLDTEIDSLTLEEIPDIESILEESLDSLPKIYPAIKRGQQVTTEFKMPIIISVN
ncbi:hypothetical protein KO566_08025 [Flavobacteriaceae bacterium XHP0103]|uniref:hypothetical protein n=1 Tax=Marixanthotalea marina TaxID=2844359 RepID=UPI00298A0555|nr:hypothetical protein [Marixanthotalea marina]MBU3822003.1 hypothetical protein [Marixanthotalea marina]